VKDPDEVELPIPHHWHGPSAWAYRALRAAFYVFGLFATVGAIAFVIFICYFFAALRGGSHAPAGEQTAAIREHGHARYVTPAVQHDVALLERFMFFTFVPGMAGCLATNALARRLRTRFAPPATIGA
jgi:hypothetical protein